MLLQGKGSIMSIGSIAGISSLGRAQSVYGMAMAAVIQMTRELSTEWAGRGVRVNCICPGWIDTGFNDPAIAMMGGPATVDPVIDTFVPMGRQGAADEIARLALFLASDESSLVTGAIFIADGGLTAM